MKIAIIGAGGAGLATGKICRDEGLDFEILEQTGKAGGTWNYTEKTGVDENGLPIHTSMYKNLKTNLPKEVMAMDGIAYPEDMAKSYITHTEVIDYIISYRDNFKLNSYIQYYQYVNKIETCDDGGLIVEIKDLKTNKIRQSKYSHVVVCNGHFFDYTLPEIDGLESFSGKIIHSHVYRVPEPYKDKVVLVVGAGPSGMNISEDISGCAKKVFLSHSKLVKGLAPNVNQKPSIRRITKGKVIFKDNTEEEIDIILCCTGYDYTFPFLDKDSGIEIIEGKYVRPLYKQVINARNPKMAFIGLPFRVCPFPMFSLQARFFIASITGHFNLPSIDEMLKEVEEKEEERVKMEIPIRYYHNMEGIMGEYFNDLADTAGIPRVLSVINKLYIQVRMDRNPNYCYKILDNETFIRVV